MAEEPRTPVAVRILRPCATEEEFLSRELETLTKTSVTLLGAPQKPQGVVLRFELALAGGEPLLRGEGRVVGYKAATASMESALTLRFTRLDAKSKGLVDRAAAVREAKARPTQSATTSSPDLAPPTLRGAPRPPMSGPKKSPSGSRRATAQPPAATPAHAPAHAEAPTPDGEPPATAPSVPPPPPSSSRTVIALAPLSAPRLAADAEDATMAPSPPTSPEELPVETPPGTPHVASLAADMAALAATLDAPAVDMAALAAATLAPPADMEAAATLAPPAATVAPPAATVAPPHPDDPGPAGATVPPAATVAPAAEEMAAPPDEALPSPPPQKSAPRPPLAGNGSTPSGARPVALPTVTDRGALLDRLRQRARELDPEAVAAILAKRRA